MRAPAGNPVLVRSHIPICITEKKTPLITSYRSSQKNAQESAAWDGKSERGCIARAVARLLEWPRPTQHSSILAINRVCRIRPRMDNFLVTCESTCAWNPARASPPASQSFSLSPMTFAHIHSSRMYYIAALMCSAHIIVYFDYSIFTRARDTVTRREKSRDGAERSRRTGGIISSVMGFPRDSVFQVVRERKEHRPRGTFRGADYVVSNIAELQKEMCRGLAFSSNVDAVRDLILDFCLVEDRIIGFGILWDRRRSVS